MSMVKKYENLVLTEQLLLLRLLMSSPSFSMWVTTLFELTKLNTIELELLETSLNFYPLVQCL
jgi:hypothetical protein